MNSIDAMEKEIKFQIKDLSKQQLLPQRKNCLFIGSGDSYVAGLVAQYLSGNQAYCHHPSEILQNPSLVQDRDVYVVSISGRTKENILAAKLARRRGSHTSAITAYAASPLAKICHDVIELKYMNSGVTTAGTTSFTSSMVTCVSLIKRVVLPDLGRIFKIEKRRSCTIAQNIQEKSFFIIGDGLLYPIAIYGALKLNEVLGAKAVAYPAEEFFHSPIFSVTKDDLIIGLGKGTKRLCSRLNREGYSSIHADFQSKGIELVLQSALSMQMLVLKLAKKHRLNDCYFLQNKGLLELSSSVIYG